MKVIIFRVLKINLPIIQFNVFRYLLRPAIWGIMILCSAQLFADDYQVSGAGTTAVNGIYYQDGTFTTKEGHTYPKYKSSSGYYIYFDLYTSASGNRFWNIDNDLDDTMVFYYRGDNDKDFSFPPPSGWSNSDVDGLDPVPTVSLYGPEIEVHGNNTLIALGDNTPSTADHTDFEEIKTNSGSVVKTYTIKNIGSQSLTISGVNVVGADFSVTQTPSATIVAGGQSTFQITFAPTQNGLRTATVTVNSNDTDEGTYDFAVQGTGNDGKPVVTTNDETVLTKTTVTLNGTVNPNGSSTTVTFEYGTTTSYGSTVTATQSPLTILGDVSFNLTGLITNTIYHYRAVGQNADGTVYGANKTFTTLADYSVSHAGTTEINGTYQYDGYINGKPYFKKIGSGYYLYWDVWAPTSEDFWNLDNNLEDSDSTHYHSKSSDFYPSEVDWDYANDRGVAPAPNVVKVGTNVSEIDIEANGQSVIDGSITTDHGNNTFFGATNITDGYIDKTFNIISAGTSDVLLDGSPKVALSGANASDFSVTAQPTSPVSSGASSPFTIRFNPSTIDTLYAIVSIENNDSNEDPYNFTIGGIGNDGKPIVTYLDASNKTKTEVTLNGMVNANASSTTVTFEYGLTTSYGNSVAAIQNPVTGSGDSVVSVNLQNLLPNTTYNYRLKAVNNYGESVGINKTFRTIADYEITNAGTNVVNGKYRFVGYLNGKPFFKKVNELYYIFTSSGTYWNIGPNVDWNDALYYINHDTDTVPSTGWSTFNTGAAPLPIVAALTQYGVEINLKGNSVTIPDNDATPSTADHTDFGGVAVSNGTIVRTFTIENLGGDTLKLTGSSPYVSLSGTDAADFSITAVPSAIIADGASTTFNVTFDPSDLGVRNATIGIANNDDDEDPYNFNIQGTGLAPEIQLKGNDLEIADEDLVPAIADSTDFGSVNIPGGSLERQFVIKNIGTSLLVLTGSSPYINISGHTTDFTLSSLPADSIVPGDSTIFRINFTPVAVGLRSASITIANNDSNETPYNYNIQGTGVAVSDIYVEGNYTVIGNGDLSPELADSTIFGNVNVDGGATKTHTFKIKNQGLSALEISGTPKVAISGHTSDYTVTTQPTSSIPANNDSTSFQITFNPTAGGSRTATLSIANNDPYDNPYTFGIGGTGIYIAPTVQASSILVSDTGAAQLVIDWTHGNGSRRVVFMSQTTTGTPSPVDDVTYIANTHFKKGSQIGTSGWYCIANGTADSVIVNGLMPNTIYRVMVCEYNGENGFEKYLTTESIDNATNQLTKNIMINEVDADTPSTDDQEFIELYDGGSGNTSLDGLILVFFNGSDDASYYRIDLNGYTTDANGFFIIGNTGIAGVGLTFNDGLLQNGPDAIALYADSVSNFPNDTPVDTNYLVDALVYGIDDADDLGILVLLNASEPQVNENGNGSKDYHSNQRIANGTGGLLNTSTYDQQPPTPGARNNALPTSANGNLAVDEDVNKTLVLTDFTYNDADSDPMLQIQLVTKPAKGSLFMDVNDDGVIDTGEELVNNDTILKTEIAANKLKYRALLNENGTPYTNFEFKVNDSLAYSTSIYTMTINVAEVNDLPIAVNDTVVTPEDTDKVFVASEFNYFDVEGSTMQQIQITLAPDDGILYNDANTDGVVDAGEELSNNEVITKAHIDANRLKFKPDFNDFGSPYASFNFKVHDGTAYSDTAYLFTIDVTPVNDLPTSADSSFGGPTNVDHIMVAGEFPFYDVDVDDLGSVLIVSIPAKGAIYYDVNSNGTVDAGEDIGNNEIVSRDMLDSNKLKYKPATDENGQPYTTFTFKVNDGTGSSTATYTMTIFVYPEFITGGIAEDMIICHNGIPNPITGLAPTGGNTPYTYQWQNSLDGVIFTDIEGATNLDYQPGVLSDTTYFRQIQTSASNCGSRITNTVTIYTLEEFISGMISSNQSICHNTIPEKLVVSAPTGGFLPYTYQWQSSTDGINFIDITGENTLEYQAPALTATTYYQLLQTSSSGCGTSVTNQVKITVYPEFQVGSISESQILYYRNTPEKFIGISPTGGSEPYAYQWQKSYDGVNYTDIYGANSLDYQAGGEPITTYFRLKQNTASGCGDGYTNTITMVVFPEFTVGSISSDQHITYNSVPEKLTATEPSGGRHPYTYQWQNSTNGINFTDIPEATSIDYQPDALTDTAYYQLIQSSAYDYADKTTNIVTIYVYPEFEVGSILKNQTVCYNTTPELIVGTEPSGGNQPYTYQWQQSFDGVTFMDITGATGLDYQPPVITDRTYYRQIQTSAGDCGSLTTNIVTLAIQAQPIVDISVDEATICANENYQLSTTAENFESVTWISLGDGSFSNVNMLNPIYFPGENDIANGSVILAINAIGISPCEILASDQIILSFYPTPMVNAGDDLTVYENSQQQLNAMVTGTGNYSYLWSPAEMLSDPTILNPVTNPITHTTTFTLVVTDNTTGCTTEDQVTFKVEPGVTYQISGTILSISLKNTLPTTQVYFTGIEQTTYTNDQGKYTMQVPAGYTGWAIPSRPGYIFEPDSIAFSNIAEDKVEQDIGGALYMRAFAYPDSIIVGQSSQLSIELIGSQNPIICCTWVNHCGIICSSEQSPIVSPTETTVYTVHVEDGFEKVFDTVRVYVSTTVGIDKLIDDNGLVKIYPNPTKNNFYVEINGDLGAHLISIVNPNGMLVRQIKLPSTLTNSKVGINLENLIDGQYYLLITNNKGILICTKKIIKI